jgi:hypothetical protein
MPEMKLRGFPTRIELRFPATSVRFPSRNQGGDFATPVPGRLTDEMSVWQPDEPGEECVFRFNIKTKGGFLWDVVRLSSSKLSLEIRPGPASGQQGDDWTDVLPIKPGGLSGIRSKPIEKPEQTAPETPSPLSDVITLDVLKLELDWPKDADVISEQISILISKYGPGYVVDLPLQLRLHMGEDSYRGFHTRPKP